MPNCAEMKMDQVYACKECGIELKVVQECKECETTSPSCGCQEPCSFECCGEPMVLKQ